MLKVIRCLYIINVQNVESLIKEYDFFILTTLPLKCC